MIFEYAKKELLNNKKFTLGFAFNLALGLWALILLDSFKVSFNDVISHRSKNLLTADIALFARRKLSDEEVNKLQKTMAPYAAENNQIVEVYSMAKSSTISRLTELRIVEDNYPFYGQLLLDGNKKADFSLINSQKKVWVAPELLIQFKSKLGDQLKIGCVDFTIDNTIQADSASSWRGVSLAPRIYIGKNFLSEMCLTGKGSTAHYAFTYKFKENVIIEDIEKLLESQFEDPSLKVVTPTKASEQVARVLNYLSDYLGLVALSAIFLSCIGSVYLFRSFINRKIKDVAILKSIGLNHQKIKNKFLIQLLFLGVSGWAISVILSQFTLPFLNTILAKQLDLNLSNIVPIKVVVISFFIATISSLVSCLPLLNALSQTKTSDLFQEVSNKKLSFSTAVILSYIPAFLFFFLLAIYQAKSFKIGGLFFAVFFGSFTLLLVLFKYLLSKLGNKTMGESISAKALTYIYRKPISSISTFLSLSLGVMLFSLVGQVEIGLKKELDFSNKNNTPSLFMFDIQEDQVYGLKELASKDKILLNALSPMVRARLLKINDKPVLREQEEAIETRENETRRRFRNRGINLSFRDSLNPSETLVAGKLFSTKFEEDSEKLPEISLEQRYAKRLDISLGDKMTFDILGVEMSGVVTSLRQVKWTSFEPNFFILFQPGAIDLAPKTYLASVNNIDFDQKLNFQNNIVDQFPNISVVDITKVVERILEIFNSMSLALKFMGIFCLIVGYMVLFSIVTSQASERKKDIALFKTLGMSFSQIKYMINFEFLLIIIVSFSTGIMLSLVSSYIVAANMFDSAWGVNFFNILIMFIFMLIFSFSIIRVISQKVLKNKVVDQLYS